MYEDTAVHGTMFLRRKETALASECPLKFYPFDIAKNFKLLQKRRRNEYQIPDLIATTLLTCCMSQYYVDPVKIKNSRTRGV